MVMIHYRRFPRVKDIPDSTFLAFLIARPVNFVPYLETIFPHHLVTGNADLLAVCPVCGQDTIVLVDRNKSLVYAVKYVPDHFLVPSEHVLCMFTLSNITCYTEQSNYLVFFIAKWYSMRLKPQMPAINSNHFENQNPGVTFENPFR